MPEEEKNFPQNEEPQKAEITKEESVKEDPIKEEPKKESTGEKTSMGLDENVAGALAYAFGWITGLIFLVMEKKSSFVRFHAMQSIVVFLILQVFGFLPLINLLVFPAGLILWVFLMVKAYQGDKYKLPIIGDFAETQAKEL